MTELRQLHQILESEAAPALRRRAEAVLLHIAGSDAIQIVAALDAHVNTIRADLHAFGRKAVPGILALGRRGAPPEPRRRRLEKWLKNLLLTGGCRGAVGLCPNCGTL